ncbi:hypothetical protein [Streptomyces beijiangensis]|uniref:Uncharacterized protein n=1 Tax=Streptomyces beijiangensis TaxID=163361 RepID=A0A939F698_9ACTN|nr:hypothetical protein [Streptomyces beijiangensis]MBO0512408.1 hypothetical protein [Streptomyces beijiangensis]
MADRTESGLLHLVGRARDGKLLLAEGDALDEGVRRLVAERDQARRSAGGQTGAIRALHRRLNAAEEAIAEAEKRAQAGEGIRSLVADLHHPMRFGGLIVCELCSTWDGSRFHGLITAHPCRTVNVLNQSQAAA